MKTISSLTLAGCASIGGGRSCATVSATFWLAIAVGTIALVSTSWAQRADQTSTPTSVTGNLSDASRLDEIIVSARKRDERVSDIPESITAISASELINKGINDVEALGRETPNLQLNMRQDLTTNVVIRGVGAYGDVLGVGFNIDNVPNFTDQTMRLEDLESVEILKGPQGTLYGGSAIGGIVRYVSKKPKFDWSGEFRAEVGSYNSLNVFAAQNLVLVPDQLALRLSGYDVKTDGYITNSALGIDGSPSTQYGVRAMLLYQPTDSVSALLTLRHARMRNGADEYIPRAQVTSFTHDAPFFKPTSNTRTTDGAVLEVNADFASRNRLTSISSYTRTPYTIDTDISFSPPGMPGLSLFTLPGNRPTEVATQEFRLTSPSTDTYDWLVGLYAADIRNVLLNRVGIASYVPTSATTVINDFSTDRIDFAGFGTFNYHIGNFTVGAGARVGETRYKANVLIEAGGLPNQSASITSRSTLPKLSVSYKLDSGRLFYASAAKGEEPGAINVTSTAPIPFKSETANSYEIGSKGNWLDRRFEYEVAAFYVKNKDHQAQTNRFIPPYGLVAIISNVGDARTYGTEANVNWRLATDLTVRASAGYLNAKWQQAAISGVPIDGKFVPNSPTVTGSLGIAYSRPVFTGLRFDGDFDMSYANKFWWDLANTPGTANPAYWLGNARIAIGSESKSWQVSLSATNIFGVHYWTEYNPGFYVPGTGPCAGCTDLGAAGAPRQIFAAISLRH